MKNLAIVCDSSVSLTPEQVKEFDVYIAPLTITHNNKTYIDQVTIFKEDVNRLLREKERLSTSQPNLGTMIDIFEEIKTKNYDHTFVLSIGTSLSGSYPTFVHAVKETKIENCTVINTHSITGPVQQGVRAIRQMNQEDFSIEEITEFLDFLFNHQVSYLYPKTLDQVVLSGRMSKTASKVASLLKIKPMLILENKADSIETLGIARTDKRNFKTVLEDFSKHSATPTTHDLYLLESEGMDRLEKFKDYVTNRLGNFKTYIVTLPAAVATHGGIGTIAIQWCPKIKRK